MFSWRKKYSFILVRSLSCGYPIESPVQFLWVGYPQDMFGMKIKINIYHCNYHLIRWILWQPKNGTDFKIITKTCLYNFDPLKPHFFIVKLGFTGVYIIFLISAPKHRLWVLVRTAHNLCFEQKYEKYQSFLPENFRFLEVEFSIYLNRHVFVM